MRGPGWGRGPRHARFQRVLAIAAIAAAVALPVVLISVGGGVADHELRALETAGYQIVVSAAGVHGITGAHTLSDRILGLAGVAYASPTLSVAVDAFNESGNVTPVLAEGVIPAQFSPTVGPSENGVFPNPLPLGDPNDSVHFANGTYSGAATYDVLLSAPYAEHFDVGVGGTVVLSTADNLSAGTRYNVTGLFGPPFSLLEPTAAYAVVLPLSDLQTLTGYASGSGTIVPDAADSIQVAVNASIAGDPAAIARIASEIHALAPAYSVSTLSQEAQQLESASSVLTGFYLALSSVGIVVGVIFLALVLLRRVEGERRSIGIRRALGLPSRAIAAGIVRDGAEIAGGGAVAGVVGGYLIVLLLAAKGTTTVREAASLAVFPGLLLGELVVGLVALSLVASAVATRVALRIPVVEALR
ncbi:MAG TPA: FtsX-like permease family protein [Thermoplasmata archaeon]|nr:FtsX-like permease family protein [Thermoplasmata archaeon]